MRHCARCAHVSYACTDLKNLPEGSIVGCKMTVLTTEGDIVIVDLVAADRFAFLLLIGVAQPI